MHLVLLFAESLSCPVLTTASVAGTLGEVQVVVSRAEKSPELTCAFTRADYKLSVEVSQLGAPDKFARFADGRCQGAVETESVKAIGNEALACRFANVADKVVGRVRNRAFVLLLSTTDKAEDAKSVRTKILALAEQVAGNLF